VPQYKILVIGDPGVLPAATCAAWREGGLCLEGPVLPASIDPARLREWAGILIDVAADDDGLMEAIDTFDRLKVPYLFVVTGDRPRQGPQPFVLGPDEADRTAILASLLDDGRRGPKGSPLS
jgi:hypothetical protein